MVHLDSGALRHHITGGVFTPDDAGFAESHLGFNLAERHRPDIVVQAVTPSDITEAIKFSTAHGLPVRVQATGHGIGIPMPGGTLISTARMRSVRIDADRCTATVSPGVQWHEVIGLAGEHGLATLCGSSPTVGVVGYTLGGGMGPMARTFGFAADRVHRITMATASGESVTVDPSREPDLFWALRGGKPSVGVVTDLEFGLVDAPHYYGGAIFFPGEEAEQILNAFAAWAPTLPNAASTSVALLRLPDLPMFPEPLRGKLSVHVRFVYVGDAEAGARLLAPIRAAGHPAIDMVGDSPAAAIASVHQDPTDPMPARDDSVRLQEFTPATVAALLSVAGPDVESPLIAVEVRLMGGALSSAGEHDSAIGGRDSAFNVFIVGPYAPPLKQVVDAASEAARTALRPWALPGKLINFQGYSFEPQDVRKAWPNDVRARLDEIDRAWDPDRVFEFAYASARHPENRWP